VLLSLSGLQKAICVISMLDGFLQFTRQSASSKRRAVLLPYITECVDINTNNVTRLKKKYIIDNWKNKKGISLEHTNAVKYNEITRQRKGQIYKGSRRH
jgi:hypothetical protein